MANFQLALQVSAWRREHISFAHHFAPAKSSGPAKAAANRAGK